ncbi:unnamed protein product [Clonostachys rosea f. rosea IK726]|uniref:Uncharacterized protein n=2 Tax=Bionectria ochroleuca TaxID=29856 RepID=A0A0B7KE59_BIOOC|nr:unnamed protein product [Clonostachys rosea f. rosea IK726]
MESQASLIPACGLYEAEICLYACILPITQPYVNVIYVFRHFALDVWLFWEIGRGFGLLRLCELLTSECLAGLDFHVTKQ